MLTAALRSQSKRLAAVGLATAVWGCSGGNKAPDAPKQETPEDRILQVSKNWQEMAQAQGFPGDPDIAFIQTRDQFAVHLKPGSHTALVSIEREELLRTRGGREYHCKVSGAVQSVVRFAWRHEEAAMSLRMPSVELDRRCRESGFPRPTKHIDAISAVYVLRGDQLIAVEPTALRSSLLPFD